MVSTSDQRLFLNRYLFAEHLAEGGSANVFRVIDTWSPGRRLVAKVQRDDDPRLGRALQREYATLLLHAPINAPQPILLHRLESPWTLGEHTLNGLVLIESEVAGLEWNDWLAEGPSNLEVLHAIATLMKSLNGLHLSGLRHGDIKPENILVPIGKPQAAAWIDFGLSDRPGILHGGTPKYLAPEALNGQPETASDLFAFGKVLEQSGSHTDLRTLATALTTWNPIERLTASQALEQMQALIGEVDAPGHNAPINPWTLRLDALDPTTRALKTRRGTALYVNAGKAEGADHWIRTASALAIKQGWTLISRDAIEAALHAAEENPLVEDATHFVLEDLNRQAQSDPLIVDAGERLPGDAIDALSIRFSRSAEARQSIVWLCWGGNKSLADWPGQVVEIPKWPPSQLERLTKLYRPELVQPQKVATCLDEITHGCVGSSTNILWTHQQSPEPDLWSLQHSSDHHPASLTKATLGLSRTPLSGADLSECLLDYQSPEKTREELAELVLHDEAESFDGGNTFTLTTPTFQKLDLEVSLESTQIENILENIVSPLATLLLPTSHPWKAHVSLVDLLESAKIHYAKREWAAAAACFHSARQASAEFTDEEVNYSVNALVRSGQVGTAITLLEQYEQESFQLRRATLMLEQGLVHEAHVALEKLAAASSSQSAKLKLSKAKLKLGKFNEAETLAQELQSSLSDEDIVERACILGIVAAFRGETTQGAAHLEPVLESYTNSPELAGKVASSLALIYQKSGKAEQSKALYLQSIACAEETYSTKTLLNRLTNLGTLEQDVHDYGSATQTYKRSLKLAQAINDKSAWLRSGLNLANLQSILGQLDDAKATLAGLKFFAQDSQFKTESAYMTLLSLDLELFQTVLPPDFQHRSSSLAKDLEELGLNIALEEAEFLAVKAEAFFRPTDKSVRTVRTWTQRQFENGRKSLGIQGLLALVRGLTALGDITSQSESLDYLASNVNEDDSPELLWAVKVLKAIRATQERDIERSSELWSLAREAHKSLNQQLPPGIQQQFFSIAPRSTLLRQQQEHISQRPKFENNNLPSVGRLFQIMRALAQETDTERLLARILDSVVMLSGAERGLLILAHKDDASLTVRATSGVYEHEEETRAFSTTIAQRAIDALQPIRSGNLQADGRFNSDHSVHILSLQSTLCLPLHAPPRVKGALYLDHRMKANAFEDADVSVLWAFADQAAIALANAYIIDELSAQKSKLEVAQRELTMVQKQLQNDLAKSRSEQLMLPANDIQLEGPMADVGVITNSQSMLLISQMVAKVAPTSLPITISGESGTGKELVAKAIHQGAAHERSGEFVALNCGAVADGLWESELFGHERGAFTGASREKPGLFEIARDGTLFLDEIGDLPLEIQVKLLRVLQQGEFRRVGGHRLLKTNARVVCATHRSLEKMVQSGTFREDLWYRLNVIELSLPPLRERSADIMLLCQHFLKRYAGDNPKELSREAGLLLQNHTWPGNIRELENELQRAIALSDDHIEPEHLSKKLRQLTPQPVGASGRLPSGKLGPLKPEVESFERHYIEKMLQACDGNRTQAAKALGLTRPGFYKKLKTLGMN